MEKKKKIIRLSILIVSIISLLGITYAWFSYYSEGDNQMIVASDLYLNLDDETDTIDLNNFFPETKEEARDTTRHQAGTVTNNTLTFSIVGKNDTDKRIFYEIVLNHGDDKENLERFNDEDLEFDLIEVIDNQDVLLLDSVKFDEINNTRIWVDNVAGNTTSEITKTYKIRMWLSSTVLVSDSDPNRTYYATGEHAFKNHYANYKVSINGDLAKKPYPLSFDLIEDLNMFSLSLSNDYLPEEYGNSANDTVEIRVSSSDTNVRFNYSYTNIIPAVNADVGDTEQEIANNNQTNVDIILNYTQNEVKKINLQVKHASLKGSNILFEVIKNGVTVEKFIKTVYKSNNDINVMKRSLLEIPNIKTDVTRIEFVNKSKSELDSEFDLGNTGTVFDLTLEEDGDKLGDVRGKLNGTTLTIASEGKTYLITGKSLFSNFENLTTIDFTNIDTSNVTTMNSMFYGSSKLSSLNLSNFNTSNVTSMMYMFRGCSGLTSLDVGSFDTSNVTTMSSMFFGCSGLTTLDVSKFVTENVTSMYGMFYGCIALTTLDVSKWETGKVKNMCRMFSIDDSGVYMALEELDVSHFDTSQVKTMQRMFAHCKSLEQIDLSNWNTENVEDMVLMFSNCSSLVELDLSSFDTSSVTAIDRMFYECSNLQQVDVSNFKTDNCTSFYAMFFNCKKLGVVDASKWNTENVTNMRSVFKGCNGLTEVYLDNFNTSNVTTMYEMFRGCNHLTTLDLSSFDTGRVTTMESMFNGCSLLQTIYSNTFATNSLTTSTNMFNGCSQLKGGGEPQTGYSSDHKDVEYARIDGGLNSSTPGYFTQKATA